MIGGHWDVLSDNENDEVYNLGTSERYVIVNGMKYIMRTTCTNCYILRIRTLRK